MTPALPNRIARLDSRALVKVSGPDARGFLQGLLTQDVEGLAEGELRFGGLLTPQGRLLFDLFLLGEGDGVVLEVAADRREALIQRLTMYRLRAAVEIAADPRPVLASWEGERPADFAPDPRFAALGGRRYGEGPPTNASDTDHQAHRLALGVPDATVDAGSDRTYPIEANFDLLNGIDFRKGCFVGQETTSRMHRRGQVKSRMLPLVFEGDRPAPGTEVLAGDLRAGEVLSGEGGRAIGLMRLDRISGPLVAEGVSLRAEMPAWWPSSLPSWNPPR